jgi:hypothetical protein
MSNSEIRRAIREAVRDGVTRALGALGLLGIALIHLLDLPGKFSETPYMAWLYVGLIVGASFLAASLVLGGERWIWKAAAGLSASVVLGYVLSRTTGLPQASDDIGNWGEPLGVASLFVEGAVIALSAGVLWTRRRVVAPLRRLPSFAPAEGLRAA